MSTPEQKIIRDYLSRKKWWYIGGALLHLACVYTTGWAKVSPLIFVLGGSAFILIFELMRGGNATTRTLLALPVTSQQLARSWRFVALTLPAVLYFIVLVIGSLAAYYTGGKLVTLERFVILAVTQTGMLGTAFFALTGIPSQPSPGAPISQRVSETFFGLLWGISVPALMFATSLTPANFAGLTTGHVLAAICLISASVGAWFRAEDLVAQRAARPGTANPKRQRLGDYTGAMPWKGVGGLSYFFKRFGAINCFMFTAMVCFAWFGMSLFTGVLPGSNESSAIRDRQLGMFIPMFALIAMLQFVPSLRVVRTMPRRLSTLTHCLVLWPFALTTALGLAAFLLLPLTYGGTTDWEGYATALLGGILILVAIPIILRFGLRVSTMIPIILLISLAQGFGTMINTKLKPDILSLWPVLAGGGIALIAIVWSLTYWTLCTAHPWRSSRLMLPGMSKLR